MTDVPKPKPLHPMFGRPAENTAFLYGPLNPAATSQPHPEGDTTS